MATDPMQEPIEAATKLHTLVWGECPGLLDEDRGGDAALDLRLEAAIAKARSELAQLRAGARRPTAEEVARIILPDAFKRLDEGFADLEDREEIAGALETAEAILALGESKAEPSAQEKEG